MADGFSTETKGMDELLARLERMKGTPVLAATVSARSTVGSYRRVKESDETEVRSAGENITIARSQAKQGRDMRALTSALLQVINDMWRLGTIAYVRSGVVADLEEAGRAVADAIVQAMRRQVESGGMKPVTPATQKRKDREGRRPGLPALVRTGQLINSLVASLSRF